MNRVSSVCSRAHPPVGIYRQGGAIATRARCVRLPFYVKKEAMA